LTELVHILASDVYGPYILILTFYFDIETLDLYHIMCR